MVGRLVNKTKKGYGMPDGVNRIDPTGSFVNIPALMGSLITIAIVSSYVISKGGIVGGALLIIATFALPALYAIIAYPLFGMTVLLVWAFFLLFTIRMVATGFPLGTTMDALEGLLIAGYFIHQYKKPDWKFMKQPISILVLLWVIYNLVEVINPAAASMMAWLFTVRTVAVIMLMYFIFSYHIRTIETVRYILKLWLVLVAIGAVYGLKQEIIGFSPTEQVYISNPDVAGLLFVGGFWRKFSIFSDPVAFSYNMVAGALVCVGLLTTKKSTTKKVILWLLIVLFLSAMIISGTRGSYVLFPAAMVLLGIIKFNKQVVVVAIILGMIVAVIIKVPTSNALLYRFQTAFKPSEDASYRVRSDNQKRLQPYIRSHPIGGGLGSVGVWGVKFAPDSFLAQVPPDSGFFRVALELGYVGLFLYCTLMFVVLKTGIDNYFKIKDQEYRGICLGMTLVIFALMIGNSPQEAFVQFPSSVYLYLEFALINIMLRLDLEKNPRPQKKSVKGVFV